MPPKLFDQLRPPHAAVLEELGWKKLPTQALQNAFFLAIERAASTPEGRAEICIAAARAIVEEALGENAPEIVAGASFDRDLKCSC